MRKERGERRGKKERVLGALAETKAEVVALKERVQTLEAIVTDSSFNVKQEINKL